MSIEDKIKGYYADCYVLTDKRSFDFVSKLLDHFIPKRTETTDEYVFPEYSDTPTEIFDFADEAIKYLEENRNLTHSFYWANTEKSELKGVEIFFTDDGQLICGIYCDTKFPNTEIEDKYFEQIKKFCDSDEGYIAYEEPSVDNSNDFREMIKARKHNSGS